MRRIEFLAPVEAMRGNLSGSQDLKYPTQNNSAWDAPSDKKSFATNYSTRYIGAKRASDGKKYFAVKQRTAVNMTAKMRLQMAVLSVSSVMANIIGKDLRTLSQLQQYYIASGYREQGWTYKRWLMTFIRAALRNKTHIYFNSPGQSSIIYINPYQGYAAPESAYELLGFPSELLWKFALELGPANIALFSFIYSGSAGTNLQVKAYRVTDATWVTQNTSGGAMSGTLGNIGLVDGQISAVRFITPASGQVKLAVGNDLSGSPLWQADGDTETAVNSTDTPAVDAVYSAHAAS